ncbi:MFS transporter [Methylobacterium oryzisoli]|uniref:MFS transporter n=1 Tax=Methylobacterium oryzisoli TaxID=3385502 RepID=UPI003891E54A
MTAIPTLARPAWRYAAFLAAYAYQGLVAGFSLTALANHYAGLGMSAGEVGQHFALAGLPWAVQPLLWGPLLDRAGPSRLGRRRAWLIAGLLGAQAALALLLLIPDERSLGLVGAVFCLHSAFAALMDTAADRLILDHVPTAELGRTSACSRAGFVLGTAAGTLLFSWSLGTLGFPASVRILLAASGLAGLLAVAVREAPGDALILPSRRVSGGPGRRRPLGRFLRRLLAAMRRPQSLRLLALCFAIDFTLALFEVRLGVALVQEIGWESGALSRAQAGLGLLAGTLGALAVGFWADRAGPVPALRGLLLACAASFGGIALLIAAGRADAAGAAILALASLAPALLVVALVPALMGASRGSGSAATQFELYMAVLNLGSVSGAAAAGAAGPLIGLAGTATLAAATFAAGTLLAARPHLILRQVPRHPKNNA